MSHTGAAALAPLHAASAVGDREHAATLLADGAVIDALDPLLQLTPLMLAARGGHIEVVSLLLEHGAAIDQTGRGGLTALMFAAMADRVHAVAALLDAGAATDTVADSGGQVVHLAASVGAVRALRLLEERGVSVFVGDTRGLSVAAYAERRGQRAVQNYLTDARLRERYRALRRQRQDPHLVRQILGPPPNRTARAAEEAHEDAQLTESRGWLPDGRPVNLDAAAEMRRITQALGPLMPARLEEALLDHQAFLQSGGEAWPGAWHSFTVDNIVFALNDGPQGTVGQRVDLHLRDLSRIDGRKAVLRRAHLIGVVAGGIDLREANLARAVVTDADLHGATLDGACLRRADLSRCDLRGASLRGADLRQVDLEGADLRGADLRNAKLAGARLMAADLREVVR